MFRHSVKTLCILSLALTGCNSGGSHGGPTTQQSLESKVSRSFHRPSHSHFTRR